MRLIWSSFPKKDGFTKLTGYRCISLCTVQYKILSKILFNQLRPLFGKCILETQVAFIPGRRTTDEIIIAKEMIHIMS